MSSQDPNASSSDHSTHSPCLGTTETTAEGSRTRRRCGWGAARILAVSGSQGQYQGGSGPVAQPRERRGPFALTLLQASGGGVLGP